MPSSTGRSALIDLDELRAVNLRRENREPIPAGNSDLPRFMQSPTRAPEATAAVVAADPMEIKAGPSILSRIKTGEVMSAEVGATITVAARVAVDDTRVTRVGSPVMGRIASLWRAKARREVRRGQLLALLNSTGLSDAQLDF
jgi:cobalt-zinc-cadmium efflux system membrane fusion protein